MKTIVKIEMHPQNSCPLFSYPYACLHLSSTVFWNQNNPWFSYPYAISVLYSSTPMLSRGMRLRVQRYENNVDDGKAISPSNTTFVAMDNSEVPHDLWPWCFHDQLKLMSTRTIGLKLWGRNNLSLPLSARSLETFLRLCGSNLRRNRLGPWDHYLGLQHGKIQEYFIFLNFLLSAWSWHRHSLLSQ